PAVEQEERERSRAVATDVVKVDVDAIDFREVLGEAVEGGFVSAPVIAVAPVVAQFADVLDIGAVVPAGAGYGVGPPSAGKASAKVVEDCVGDVDLERPGRHARIVRSAAGESSQASCSRS